MIKHEWYKTWWAKLSFTLLIAVIIFKILSFGLNATDGIGLVNSEPIYSQANNQEQTIIDEQKSINVNMQYYNTFEVYTSAKVNINITSGDVFNYVLIPDYELAHYTKGESYKSYADLDNLLFHQEIYNLNAGKYSVVITSTDKPLNIHLVVKVTAN